MQKFGVSMKPALTINGFIYRGQFDYGDLVSAVCSGYTIRPKECKNKLNEYNSIRNDRLTKLAKVFHIVAAVVVVVLLNFGCLFVFRMYHKRKQ